MLAKSRRLTVVLFVTWAILSTLVVAYAQGQAHLANSNGTGSLKLGREEFKVNAVVIKLLEGGQAEITLVSDITVFLNGKWTKAADHEFSLEISGGPAGNSLTGGGRVTLGDDDKSVKQLTLKGGSKMSKRTFQVSFTGQ